MKNIQTFISFLGISLISLSLVAFPVFSSSKPQNANPHRFTPRVRLKNGSSLNWGGYAVETNLSNPQNKAVTDVKGSWIVAGVTCPAGAVNSYSATWLGIDGDTDNTVEQIGTGQDCINGLPQYYAWYEMYPKASHTLSIAVNPGDTMTAEVSYIGNNYFSLKLTDTSTGKSFNTLQRLNAQRQSAEWIVEAPYSGGILPLANFGTQTFSGAQTTLNGHSGTISDSAWQNDKITMTNSTGTPKATPSSLSPGGSGFKVTWNSN